MEVNILTQIKVWDLLSLLHRTFQNVICNFLPSLPTLVEGLRPFNHGALYTAYDFKPHSVIKKACLGPLL